MDAPILHLSIPVADLAAARAFYEGALGCSVGRVRDDWLDVWFFGLQLTLQQRPDEVRPTGEQGVRHFGVVLPDAAAFEDVVDRLDRADVEWLSRPTVHRAAELSGKVGAKVADPSGNVVEIKHYEDPSEFLATD
ncbi:VOC family protein [Dermatobacter hominis]|uniref:VOC family protein n=1 Tax=Dermatobacter hominis TaxID=2884263 RepID=UPI001D10BCA2|nr:VOC family protein [Dermatobacter hominis]UDY38012.1 VOC family protein [Dermatobacter hominis]